MTPHDPHSGRRRPRRRRVLDGETPREAMREGCARRRRRPASPASLAMTDRDRAPDERERISPRDRLDVDRDRDEGEASDFISRAGRDRVHALDDCTESFPPPRARSIATNASSDRARGVNFPSQRAIARASASSPRASVDATPRAPSRHTSDNARTRASRRSSRPRPRPRARDARSIARFHPSHRASSSSPTMACVR